MQVDVQQHKVYAAEEKAGELDMQLQSISQEKDLAAQQQQSASKRCAQLDKQVMLIQNNLQTLQLYDTMTADCVILYYAMCCAVLCCAVLCCASSVIACDQACLHSINSHAQQAAQTSHCKHCHSNVLNTDKIAHCTAASLAACCTGSVRAV